MNHHLKRRHLVLCAAILLSAACSDDSTTGPATTTGADGGADGSVTGDAQLADTGGPDLQDVAAPSDGGPADVPVVACLEDVDCANVNVPLCNAAKCMEGKCAPFPTAEGVGCDDGNACSTGDVCQGGLCQGVLKVCNDAKPCTVDTCDAATGECSSTPANEGEASGCDDGDACTDQDACVAGACAGKPVVCSDDNVCTDDSCDLANGCLFKNNNKPCGDAAKCDSGGACVDGKCAPGDQVGCDDGDGCTVDACDEGTGLCVYKPGPAGPCDDGDACTTGEACAEGKCVGGGAVTCPEGDACKPQACNPADGQCAVKLVDGVACDDGNACTAADACSGGACNGGAKVCDDADPCTDDGCNVATGCTATANTAPCADDAKCLKGICAAGKCKVGSESGCNDANPCTTDACKAGGGCVYTPAKDGTACADKDACQEASLCKAGKCAAGAKADCDDLNPCTDDSCHPQNGCGWVANDAACEDGNLCTKSDKCSNGKCGSGTVMDPAKDCDDDNSCTIDSCDKASGCVHAENSGKCDDGSVCTSDETCKEGKCVGSQSKCEDGGPCKTTNCDAKTGDCSWGSKTGACDDGDFCTTGTVCGAGSCGGGSETECDDKNVCTTDSCDSKAGSCAYVPVADATKCDDGDSCTSGDACKGGECAGGGAPVCDDGNVCTVDKCDPASGKCSFGPNKAPCDAGDPCTYGDTCSNGKCVTGKSPVCYDGSACTTDACDPKTGACKFAPTKDGGPCKDGLECTINESCKAGKCVAGDGSKCALFSDTFECKDAGADWWLDKPGGKKVIWLVDKTPLVGGEDKSGCNLNFNNGKDYCDPAGKSCQKPDGAATSPLIDGTKLGGAATVAFRTWYDLDGGNSDLPRVEFINEAGQTLYSTFMSKSSGNMKVWRDIKFDVNQVKGQKFRIRFRLYNTSGSGGNDGKGWFVDDLEVTAKLAPEVCTDGVDNDGNGLVDCLDAACKGKPGCLEICGDGKDNDFDDKTDCMDTDCKNAIDCQTAFFSRDFACGEAGWNVVDMKRNNVTFAIDKTPAIPAPVIADCTMNFNNGTDFCGTKGCSSNNSGNANAAIATYNKTIDAAGYKTLTAVYWSWIDAEPYAGNTVYYDRGFLQVSMDNFKGCCGATYSCGGLSNTCNTANTNTWIAPRLAADQKKWRKVQINLNKYAGKKFQLRYRFNSGDGQHNNTTGWFVDKLRLYGTK